MKIDNTKIGDTIPIRKTELGHVPDFRDRIVITGMGAVTPIGRDLATIWANVTRGQSGIQRWNGEWREIWGHVPVFPVALVQPYAHDARRAIGFALEAAQSALKDAGLVVRDAINVDPTRIGLAVGNSKGGVAALEEALCAMTSGGVDAIAPKMLDDFFHHGANEAIMRQTGISGPCLSPVSACSTGAHSIMLGARWILDDQADYVLAGAAESSLTPLVLSGFGRMDVLATADRDEDPKTVSRPYDRTRRGFVVGEGAGVVVLERLSGALRRGAKIYAELAGWSLGADAYKPVSFDPSGQSIECIAAKCAQRMQTEVREIDYINCHGTGTHENDTIESRALRRLLDQGSQRTALSSTKPMTGHLLGAAGSVEFILTVLALQNDFVPATLNLKNPDPACALDYTPREGRPKRIDSAMTLSYGFGGNVAALGIRKI